MTVSWISHSGEPGARRHYYMLDACGLLGLVWWMAVILLARLVLSAVQSSCSYPHPSYDQGGYFDSTL